MYGLHLQKLLLHITYIFSTIGDYLNNTHFPLCERILEYLP